MEENKHALRGILCTALGGVLWGFSGTCGQYLFTRFSISSLWLTCVRLVVSGIVLTLLAIPKESARLRAIWKYPRDVIRLLIYGVCGLMLCQLSYMTAISYSNAATATVLQTLNLVFTMLVVCLWKRRLPISRETISLILAIVGTYLMATGGDPGHLQLSGWGLFWGLTTAASVTVYVMLAAWILPRWGRMVVTGYGMLTGGLVLSLSSRIWRMPISLPTSGWLAVCGVVLLGTILPFPLFMQGVADIGPVKSSMIAATEPVAATLFSALWLKTRFSAADLIGFLCIIATIFLLARPDHGAKPTLCPETAPTLEAASCPENCDEKEPSEESS